MNSGEGHSGSRVGCDDRRPSPPSKGYENSETGRGGLLQIAPTQGRGVGRRSSQSHPGVQRRESSGRRRRGSSLSVGSQEEQTANGGCGRRRGNGSKEGRGVITPREPVRGDRNSADRNLSKRRGSDPVHARDEAGRRPMAPDVSGWLAELDRTEALIRRALSQWAGGRSEEFDHIRQLSSRLQGACENLILVDLELCLQREVGSRVWRSTHYPVIEILRKQQQSKAPQARDSLLQWLADVLSFYSHLVERTQEVYDFQLSRLLSGETRFRSKSHHRTVMMAVFVCQWSSIFLGDVSRYQEQLMERPNWARPRAFYLRAQQLAPKDGKPYSRLAIVAINAHRRLDAVYYYMRSLTAKNPFQSAHESLVGLFEETSKKAKKQEENKRKERERAEKERLRREKRAKEAAAKKKQSQGQVSDPHSARKEVWLMPGREKEEGKRGNVQRDAHARHDQFDKLSSAELTKKLISSFLVAHGKLFTKIGIETADQALERLHRVWLALLSKEAASLPDAPMLVKMVVINIFSIHHAAETHKESNAGLQYYCSLGLRLALNFTVAMLQACTNHLAMATHTKTNDCTDGGDMGCGQAQAGGGARLEGCRKDGEDSNRSDCVLEQASPGYDGPTPLLHAMDKLVTLLPAVRIWFDWLVHQQALWLPFVPALPRKAMQEFLVSAAEFVNRCSAISGNITPSDTDCPRLWEDRELAGFMPLHKASADTFTIPDISRLSTEEHRGQCLQRVGVLARDLRALAMVSRLPITIDEGSTVFSVRETVSEALAMAASLEPAGGGKDGAGESEGDSDVSSDDIIVDEEEEEGGEPHPQSRSSVPVEDATSDSIAHLKAQRELLTQQIAQQQQAKDTVQAVLDEAAMRGSKVVCITPKYLVPDTNCFVSMLPSVRALVQSRVFTVAVPLTVLSELEGLGKESSKATSDRGSTGSGAKAALAYVSEEFSSHCRSFRALTTQGSLLPSLSFRAELTEKASNDDLILESCLSLHRKVDCGRPGTAAGVEDGESYSVVLLTDDRNLRVKAHAAGLPVKDLPTFMTLFRDTKTHEQR